MGRLVAGTKYRRQFEERLGQVVHMLQACAPAILFIDEMHLVKGPHGIEIPDAIVKEAVELTNRHMVNRHQTFTS